MSFILASRPIHPQLQRRGNPRLQRQKLLLWKVLLQKTAIFLSLPMLFLLAVSGGRADSARLKAPESAAAPNDPATVLRVKLLLEKDSPILEIMCTRPVKPVITKIQDPAGLRIDLGNSQMSVRHKEVTVHNPLIGAIHLDPIALIPPVVSIVVNELKPLSYTWDAAGNRLTIRLHMESEEAKARPPSVPVLTRNPETEAIAVPASTAGRVVFADRQVSGSSFSAGFNTETLRLSRGGEVHICPGTRVSIIHPQNGGDLLLAMGVGALETHYALEESADTSIGNGQFEVVPSEQVVFHAGHLSSTDTAFHSGQLARVETVVPEDCGCPAPVPVLRAELSATPLPAENNISPESVAPQSRVEAELTRPTVSQNASIGPEIAPLAKEKPADFEATFVFSRTGPPPPKPVDLPLSGRQIPLPDATVALPALPPVINQKAHKGVFRKMTGFFSRIFR